MNAVVQHRSRIVAPGHPEAAPTRDTLDEVIVMLSRRDAVKLGAAGVLAPIVGQGRSPAAFAAQSGDVPTVGRRGDRATGPSSDEPVIVQWRARNLGWLEGAPTIRNGMIYQLAPGLDDSVLFALDAATGTARWRTDIPGMNAGALVANEDLVIVSAYSHRSGLDRIQAYDARSGVPLWKFGESGAIVSDATIAGDRVYVTKDGVLYALDATTGEVIQQLRESVGGRAIVNEGTIYIFGYNEAPYETYPDKYIVAIDETTETERWHVELADYNQSQGIAGGLYFYNVYETGTVIALNSSTGKERWRYETIGPLKSPLNVSEDLVIVDSPSLVIALDARTGKERWSYSLSTGPIAAEQDTGNKTVFLGGLQRIWAVNATTGKSRWDYEADLIKGGTAVGNGIVCAIFGDENLVALGNLPASTIIRATRVRDTPSQLGIERGQAVVGDSALVLGSRHKEGRTTWLEVTVNGVTGWIPLGAIDPATLPPEGEIEYVYKPT